MDKVDENAIETTFEHKFARDVIHFVLHEYMTGLHWNPTGIFGERDLDTPFTPQLKQAIKELLDFDGLKLHRIYDEFFPDKSVVEDNYTDIIQRSKFRFISNEFDIGAFISYSALLAIFAAWSYHYGANSAPFVSYKVLVETFRELKKLGKIDDNIWNEIQTWLENNKWPIRLWASELDTSEE